MYKAIYALSKEKGRYTVKSYRITWKYATRSMLNGDIPWQDIASKAKIYNAQSPSAAIAHFKSYLGSKGGESFSLNQKDDSVVFFNRKRQLLLVWYDFKARYTRS